ncbi:MAG: hypothetical protein KC483_02490 [Nitrosarchaeum sp.]|nr:hypothetical protein [Nitrosarchaeum sp.]
MNLPDYTCEHHISDYHEKGKIPDCLNGKGCRVGQSIAEDEDIDLIVKNYLSAKSLPISTQIPDIALRFLDEAGLLEHSTLLAELEVVYHRHKKKEQDKENIKKSHKKNLR